MPLSACCWMRMSVIYYGWRNDKPHYCFMSDKGATAIDILTLAVTFFCAISDLKAAPSVR